MTDKLFRLALKYVDANPAREDSARLCLASARQMQEAGQDDAAEAWLVRSLKHSIGILHPEFPAIPHKRSAG